MPYGIRDFPSPTSVDPFDFSATFASDTSRWVQDRLELIEQLASSSVDSANTFIDALQTIGTDLPDYSVPDPVLGPQINLDFTVDPLADPSVFGAIDEFQLTHDINTSGLPDISDVNVPAFSPTEVNVYIPPAPTPGNYQSPGDAPGAPTFDYPDSIVIQPPGSPDFFTINVPPSPDITIPDFDPEFPTFNEADVNTNIAWTEETYSKEVIDSVLAQIETFFAGGSGIDPVIEESLFARGRDREDRIVRGQEQEAIDEWANRSYSQPPGMLAKRLDNIREEGMVKKLGLNREMLIKVHNDELENLRFATQQGIQAERLFVELFLARMERLFEAEKLSVQWQVELYRVGVEIFRAKMQEVQIRAQVYETKVRALQFEIEIFKALIEAESLKNDINRALVDRYQGEIEARKLLVDAHEVNLRALQTQADVYGTTVNGYRAEVEAYAALVATDRNKFDAYASQIRGETAKVGLVEAEARAYAAEVSGIEAGVRAEVAALQGEVSAIDAEIRNYEAKVRGLLGKAQVQLQQIQANVSAHEVDVRRKNLEIEAETSASRIELEAIRATSDFNRDQFDSAWRAYDAKLREAIAEIDAATRLNEAAGRLSSTIASGALAAMHVGATISGSGSVSASGSDGVTRSVQSSTSCQSSNSVNISYASPSLTGVDCPQVIGSDSSSSWDPNI